MAAVTPAELSNWFGRVARRSRATVVLTGAPAEGAPEAWLDALPAAAPTVTSTPTAQAEESAALDILVVDAPFAARGRVLLGWAPPGLPGEATATVGAACLARRVGRDAKATWQAPWLALARTSSVGFEAEALAQLRSVAKAERAPDLAEWRAGVRTATQAIGLELRDARRAADALAMDRLAPQRSLRPVLARRMAALREPPSTFALGQVGTRPMAVVVTRVQPNLVTKLSALEGVGRIQVVAWDQR